LTEAKAVSAENELADLKKYIDILQEQMGNLRKRIGELTTQVEFYKAGLVNLQNGLEQLKATATITIVGGNAHGHKY
jgi:chromosome segregation ATPase